MWVVGEVGALGGGGGGEWVPLPPYITMGALGLDAIVYIERLFSLPHWMTNFPSTNEIKKVRSNQSGSVPKSTSFCAWRLEKNKHLATKLETTVLFGQKNNKNRGNASVSTYMIRAGMQKLNSRTDTSAQLLVMCQIRSWHKWKFVRASYRSIR